MTINEKITIKNYKCFNSTKGGGFDKIMPINVIIGKNNSGKSSLINVIQFLVDTNNTLKVSKHDSKIPEVLIEHTLSESIINKVFPDDTNTKTYGPNAKENKIKVYELGQKLIGGKYTYKVTNGGQKSFFGIEYEFILSATAKLESITDLIKLPFTDKSFCKISAERDINPEESNSELKFNSNGVGSTNFIQEILNKTDKDSNLIEKKLLTELNIIINPDITFSRIMIQLDNQKKWELFFEDTHDNRISLSKMGSGLKTVLLVLLNLIVRPEIEGKDRSNYVFAFEELENNLHPSLQRRLYDYIKEYSKKYHAYFFLTTHSNVVIDSFGTDENSQLIHVSNDGETSVSNTVLSDKDVKQILNDLGLKASDILQSNGIIWVEGPSDRNYINKWIKVISPELKEGLHYVIMFYGGRLLSNLNFDFEWFDKNVIPLLKINQNVYVVIDRDGKTINTKLNQTKKRIQDEIGKNRYWITEGREIENYLSDKTLSDWINEKHNYNTKIKNDKDIKLEENIANSNKKIKLKYNLKKRIYSSEISEYIDENSLNILDLRKKIKELTELIKKWNK